MQGAAAAVPGRVGPELCHPINRPAWTRGREARATHGNAGSSLQPHPGLLTVLARGQPWSCLHGASQTRGNLCPWQKVTAGEGTAGDRSLAPSLRGCSLPQEPTRRSSWRAPHSRGSWKSPGHDFQHGTWPNSTPLAVEPAQPAHPIPGELCTSTHTAPGAPSCPQITRWAAGQEQSLACAAPWGAVPHPQGPGSAPQVVGHPHHQREPRGVRTLCPCVCTARTPQGGYTNLSPQARITASILL